MTSESTGINSTETQGETSEHRRFNRLRRAGLAAAGVTMVVTGALYGASEMTQNPGQEPAPVTSPNTTGQGDIDFRFTLDEDVAECRERMQALDDCIASDFGGTNEEPVSGQADVPDNANEYIAECRELRPLDACIAGAL